MIDSFIEIIKYAGITVDLIQALIEKTFSNEDL